MRRTRMLNFMKGLIVIGVAFFWLMNFEWFQTLIRNLLIGVACLIGILLIYFGVNIYRRLKEK